MKVSRISAFLAVTVLILLAALIAKCPRTEDTTGKPTAVPTVIPTPAPTVSLDNTIPANAADTFVRAEFPYSCKMDGKKAVATFDKKLGGNFMVGAIGDVIGRCFDDKADVPPRVAGVGPEQVIRIKGKKHGYIVVPLKEPTGEIHSLVITQVTD